MLCHDIVRKHLPDEVELYEAMGDELIASARAEVILTPQQGGDAEFGASAGADLDFVIVWQSLEETVRAIKGRAPDDAEAVWVDNLVKHGMNRDLARGIAQEFRTRLVELAA
jgi:hypothetical protein